RFLRLVLADDVLVQNRPDFLGLRNILQIHFLFRSELLFHDLRAEFDAFIAYIDARTGDQLAHLILRLAAEGALQLALLVIEFEHFDILPFVLRHWPAASGRVMTLSINPYSSASWALMKKSRSVSRSI